MGPLECVDSSTACLGNRVQALRASYCLASPPSVAPTPMPRTPQPTSWEEHSLGTCATQHYDPNAPVIEFGELTAGNCFDHENQLVAYSQEGDLPFYTAVRS